MTREEIRAKVASGELEGYAPSTVKDLNELASVIRSYSKKINELKGNIRDLQEDRKEMERELESLREIALNYMQENQLGEVKTSDHTVEVDFSRSTIYEGNIEDLPPSFVRVKKEVNKVALKAALEGGLELEGAYIQKKAFVKVS